ncbi:MAG: DUF3347 domain-containing protein [Bacteroidetes bacterium]|nr:DUF3347 domain-containing protein [Bacteroidota bacterium]
MKKIIITALAALFTTSACQAQIKNAKTATVKVSGNCEMCEKSIETAASKKKVSKADWNKDTKQATITYDSTKTSLDAVLKDIALAGYDNQSYAAPDAAYSALPDCCLYTRERPEDKAFATTTSTPDTKQIEDHQQAPAKKQSQLKDVFVGYFSLKDALVQSDAKTATVQAKALETALNKVAMDQLSHEEHEAWMKEMTSLKQYAGQLGKSKDLAQQRSYFMSLSSSMYALMKAATTEEPIYFQHCPMANGGKGADWLSREMEIKNPYYGAKMLSCGSIQETLK